MLKKIFVFICMTAIFLLIPAFKFNDYSSIDIEKEELTNGSVIKISNLSNYNCDVSNLLLDLGVEKKDISSTNIEDYNKAKEILIVKKMIQLNNEIDTNSYDSTPNRVRIDDTFWGEGELPDPNKHTTYFEGSNLEIVYTVLYLGNREYKFFMEAYWLEMPGTTFIDSLGAMSMNMTVINESRYGWYSYDRNIVERNVNGEWVEDDAEYIKNDISEQNYYNSINGNWYGSACTFTLPKSDYTDYVKIICSNFKVHYEFKGHYNGDIGTFFNTLATYDHSQINFNFSPEISISLDSGNFGIGLANSWLTRKHVKYNAEFPTDIEFKYI